MRKVITLIALLSMACAPKNDGDKASLCIASPVLGSWTNGSETLTFNSNCEGTSDACGSTFKYPNFVLYQGLAEIEVTSTNSNPACLPQGKTTCEYEVSGNLLGFDCGGGVNVYTKL